MKIMVTGGAGFIASHIVDAYIADGHDVVILDNMSSGKKENINAKAKFYNIDICDAEIEKIFETEQPEILNHHAAQIDIRKSVEDPAYDCRVNVQGFLRLMEAARKNRVQKIIFASSGGAIYGEQECFPAYEDHTINPVSPYGVAKFTCEKYLHYYYAQYGISYIAFRYANIYGPRQNPHGEAGVVAIFINNILNRVQSIINGEGTQTRDYVYVDDVVELNRYAVGSNSTGCYNVGTGIEADVNTIFDNLCEIMKNDVPAIHGSMKPGEQLRSSINSKKIVEQFNFQPRTKLMYGLRKTVEWFNCQ